MKPRKHLFLALLILELASYLALVLVLPPRLSTDVGIVVSRMFRLLAAQQLLIPAALFFLWLDLERYRAYLPLLGLGKLLNLVSLGLLLIPLLPRILFGLIADAALLSGSLIVFLLVNLAVLLVVLYQIKAIARSDAAGTSTSEPLITSVEAE